MPGPKSELMITDGSSDFSGGIDSIRVTTIQGPTNPNGLARNQLAWLDNATVRDGGIRQRTGWQFISRIAQPNGFYQGGLMYEPDFAFPYLLLMISGHIIKVDPNNPAPVDLSLANNPILTMPATPPRGYFVQAEQFGIIQAGDYALGGPATLPLFWDGATLRRSKGIVNPAVPPGTPGVNEIPGATAMDYYMGRLWYAQGRTFSAGDIVRGPSGTGNYAFRDSVLEITENPLVLGGDGFTVPSNAGNLRALFHNANLNTQLGDGQFFAGSSRAIYNLTVPVSRSAWIGATNSNQPLLTVAQINNGPIGDWCITKVNGDVFYQSSEPAIRSLFSAIRDFGSWGNTSLSANEDRILSFNDRSLLSFSSGIFFDNRMLQTALPVQRPQGVVNQALVPLDFMPMSDFGANLQPNWEGMYEGLDILQLFTGDFGGRERAFAVIVSRLDNGIDLWELTDYQRSDYTKVTTNIDTDGESRVTWIIETPAYTGGDEFKLKELAGGELWFDKIFGEVIVKVEWRPDSDPCWKPWHEFKLCAPRSSCETVLNPVCYPAVGFREAYKATKTLPHPPETCDSLGTRRADWGYQHQLRLTIKGWCRVRGIRVYMYEKERKPYDGLEC